MAIVAATIFIGILHWQNDGLWFQGDAPRHAANGLFIWDLLTELPTDPFAFALAYYARYPVLAIGPYPPLFYLIEGLAFGLFGPSPWVAKTLVLGFAAVAGFYTMLWGRRWIGPIAGWAGACAILLPGFVRYSNAVLLNVPATALGIAALYYFQLWLDARNPRHGNLFIVLAIASVLTYYPAVVGLAVVIAWMICANRRAGTTLHAAVIAALGLAVILLAAILMPRHLDRHGPALQRLLNIENWEFYAQALSALTGTVWTAMGLIGLLCAIAVPGRRRAAVRLAMAIPVVTACLVLLPATDERYALLLAPMMVLASFLAIAALIEAPGVTGRAIGTTLLAGGLLSAPWVATRTALPSISGFEHVAAYLRANATRDAVLYSGRYDGMVGFYLRARDPEFESRLVRAERLLYSFQQTADFQWVETPRVSSKEEVVAFIRNESGCRWIAVEVGPNRLVTATGRLLREALTGPEFERAASIPVNAASTVRVDIYRVLLPVEPTPVVNVDFPSYSGRVFKGIEPVRRQR